MVSFNVGEWVTRECPIVSTHALKGSFVDPELDAQAATGLFCYNQTTGMGAFFALGKKDAGDNAPQRIGKNHKFVRQWTHLVYIPIASPASPLPHIDQLLLFYDAAFGMAEVYETDGNGNLKLKKQHRGWRTHWTQMIGGQFGKANLLFYDANKRVGAFYTLSKSGDIQFIEGWL